MLLIVIFPPLTSNFAPGVAVPIPTFPALLIVILGVPPTLVYNVSVAWLYSNPPAVFEPESPKYKEPYEVAPVKMPIPACPLFSTASTVVE